MKKLLILMLVLGMTSAANAVLTWSADEVTIDLTSPTAVLQIISSTALAYPGGPAWVGAEPSTVAEIASIVALSGAGEDAELADPATSGYPGWWTISAKDVTGTPGDTIVAGSQWDVTITGLMEGVYVISADSYGSAGSDDLLTITVVPEPMTIALLGLGGLFLLRRRK
ncbi:MAG TPA: PEP-CTERM sorting domain-containing protein [Sedimentisphaerales bacterium]|nr:PEP-CTERM sorting domain-containing protein [Sedimentisphaerales bacterium]